MQCLLCYPFLTLPARMIIFNYLNTLATAEISINCSLCETDAQAQL
jgi:hypothetical protein